MFFDGARNRQRALSPRASRFETIRATPTRFHRGASDGKASISSQRLKLVVERFQEVLGCLSASIANQETRFVLDPRPIAEGESVETGDLMHKACITQSVERPIHSGRGNLPATLGAEQRDKLVSFHRRLCGGQQIMNLLSRSAQRVDADPISLASAHAGSEPMSASLALIIFIIGGLIVIEQPQTVDQRA